MNIKLLFVKFILPIKLFKTNPFSMEDLRGKYWVKKKIFETSVEKKSMEKNNCDGMILFKKI